MTQPGRQRGPRPGRNETAAEQAEAARVEVEQTEGAPAATQQAEAELVPANEAPAGQGGADQADAEPVGAAPRWLVVVGPARGRHRAGRAFGPVKSWIELADLSAAELAAIEGDPELLTTREA